MEVLRQVSNLPQPVGHAALSSTQGKDLADEKSHIVSHELSGGATGCLERFEPRSRSGVTIQLR